MLILCYFLLELLCLGLDGQFEAQLGFFFGFRLTQDPLVNSPYIDKQLLFPIGSPNCTLSTFPGGGLVVGKCVTKENPKSDLDLGLRVCQHAQNFKLGVYPGIDHRNIFFV